MPEIDPSKVPEHWGGYQAEFKLIARSDYHRHGGDANLHQVQRRAIATGPQASRRFTIDFSRREFIGEPSEIDVESVIWRVYHPGLLLCEKVRAICQQDPIYVATVGKRRTRRPRDFLDIYEICEAHPGLRGEDLEHTRKSLAQCFAAKQVPLALIGRIEQADHRDWHAHDWGSAAATTTRKVESFEVYHRYVSELCTQLLEVSRDV